MLNGVGQILSELFRVIPAAGVLLIGAKPNLVCGGSPKVCVLVERKALALAAKTSLDQLFVQHLCTVMDEFNGNNLQLPTIPLQGPSTLQGPQD